MSQRKFSSLDREVMEVPDTHPPGREEGKMIWGKMIRGEINGRDG